MAYNDNSYTLSDSQKDVRNSARYFSDCRVAATKDGREGKETELPAGRPEPTWDRLTDSDDDDADKEPTIQLQEDQKGKGGERPVYQEVLTADTAS